MDEWLAERLAKLGLDDEAVISYCKEILVEETIEDDEKREALSEFLSEAAQSDDQTATLIDSFISECLVISSEVKKKIYASNETRRLEEIEHSKSRELEVLKEEVRAAPALQNLSVEERKKREAFLDKYGFEDDDEVVESANGESETPHRGKEDSSRKDDPLVPKNENVTAVKMAEQAKRAKAQAEHAKIVQKNKQDLERQKLEKEKDKRRTEKKEKRRM